MIIDDMREEQESNVMSLITVHLDVYKHHFELYLKGYALFLGIIGTTSGYYFNIEDSSDVKTYLGYFITLICLMGSCAWAVCHLWVREHEKGLAYLYQSMPISPPPMFGARLVTLFGAIGAVVFAIMFVVLSLVA